MLSNSRIRCRLLLLLTRFRRPMPFHVGNWGEAAAHGVLCNSPRNDELQQVIRSAGLGADARELEAAERLAIHQGPGDLAIDVQVADAELPLDALDVGRAARVEA